MRLLTTLLTTLLFVVLAACTADDGSDGSGASGPEEKPTSSATPAKAAPQPKVGTCHAMSFEESVAPTDTAPQVPCGKPHTAQTFHVDDLATVIDGHLVTVDSDHAQQQIATECPARFARFVGGSDEQRRLSMLSVAWFSPTVEQSDAGQDWFRCDITLVRAPGKLGRLPGDLEGALDTEQGRERFGMCSTGEPGTAGFRRVVCSANHSWQAIGTIDVPAAEGGAYPGPEAAQDAGSSCEDTARAEAEDALSFTWGYEWPTREQWEAGRHYGYCWVPTG